MSRFLLDVNVLIALIDPEHIDHERAHTWAQSDLDAGWATCALTQNGFARIVSQPQYPGSVTVRAAIDLLRAATSDSRHEFWGCDLPLTDARIRAERLLGPRQITDSYLLALAVQNEGVLVTSDSRIDPETVEGVTARHLRVL